MDLGVKLGAGELFLRLDYLYVIGKLETLTGNPSPATAALGYRLLF